MGLLTGYLGQKANVENRLDNSELNHFFELLTVINKPDIINHFFELLTVINKPDIILVQTRSKILKNEQQNLSGKMGVKKF